MVDLLLFNPWWEVPERIESDRSIVNYRESKLRWHPKVKDEFNLDLDAVLMALYLLDYPEGQRFATPEPLGPGGDPYPAMFGQPNAAVLDTLVAHTASYWRKREEQIKTLV